MKDKINVIAFDADDTLWVNEPYFQETEKQFCALLENYAPHHTLSQELFRIEMKNLPLYGYGIKSFMLSMIEAVYDISGGTADMKLIPEIIRLGQEMLQHPIELLDGVREVLEALKGRYRLVVATKGDLLDQERKLKKSGLLDYFHHIEIMSDKKADDYRKLLKRLDCTPDEFLMMGNSLKADVIPVLELNGYAAHIPYHTMWAHEHYEGNLDHPRFLQLNTITDILNHVDHETRN
ncbi:HAD family hydrolase [Taibaiella koreensis]|uniref:HAD family hydrolase n=1 Tax=Taibaiella koreensis TaxID=1268548 RepID=UPI000E59E7FB|nr:HAD family hydrolase [Taibaiella koreensis]